MQGFNMGRYVPPDAEGVLTANQASGKGHALGARASRLKSQGVLTVRFEMPFAVWCDTCSGNSSSSNDDDNSGGGNNNENENTNKTKNKHPVIIGQGVRFNAEKKKIGTYYSSPVYSFRMRHAPCGGYLEIHTDPKNTAYVVASGGRKRDTGPSTSLDSDSLLPSTTTTTPILTPHEHSSHRASAFAHLEKTIADRAALAAASDRLDAIGALAARQWDDPYARNQALRATFRAGRRAREREARRAGDLRERIGWHEEGIRLLPESEDDARRAALVEFGRAPSPTLEGGGGEGGVGREAERVVFAKPLFDMNTTKKTTSNNNHNKDSTSVSGKKKPPPPPPPSKKLKSELAASKRKQSLVSEIMGNTRMASDPFLAEPKRTPASSRESTKLGSSTGGGVPFLPGLKKKRKRDVDVVAKEPSPTLLQSEEGGGGPPGKEKEKEKGKGAVVSSGLGLVDYDSD